MCALHFSKLFKLVIYLIFTAQWSRCYFLSTLPEVENESEHLCKIMNLGPLLNEKNQVFPAEHRYSPFLLPSPERLRVVAFQIATCLFHWKECLLLGEVQASWVAIKGRIQHILVSVLTHCHHLITEYILLHASSPLRNSALLWSVCSSPDAGMAWY